MNNQCYVSLRNLEFVLPSMVNGAILAMARTSRLLVSAFFSHIRPAFETPWTTTVLYLHCSPKVLLVCVCKPLSQESYTIMNCENGSENCCYIFSNLVHSNGFSHRKQHCFTVSSFSHAQNKLADVNTIFFCEISLITILWSDYTCFGLM